MVKIWLNLMVTHNNKSWLNIYTIASHLSTHLFKYTSRLNTHFMTKFLGINIFQWNISWIVIWRKFWFFLRLALKTTVRTLAWNSSNDFLRSSNASLASVWTLKQSNWSSISRIYLYKDSNPWKSTLSCDSTICFGWLTSLSSSIPIALRHLPTLLRHILHCFRHQYEQILPVLIGWSINLSFRWFGLTQWQWRYFRSQPLVPVPSSWAPPYWMHFW